MEQNQEKRSFLQKVPGFRSGKLWKKVIASWFYAFVLMVIVIAIIDPEVDDSSSEAPKSNVAQEQPAEQPAQEEQAANVQLAQTQPVEQPTQKQPVQKKANQKQQDAFIAFYDEIMDLYERSDRLNELVVEGEALVSAGQGSVNDLYSLVAKSRDSSQNIWMAINKVSVPKNLSKAHQKELNEAKDSLSMAVYCRTNAYKAYLKYLDTRLPSDANKMKEEMASSSRHMMIGVAKLVSVKIDLGIEDK